MHIELLRPHTHAGRRLAAGDRLDLHETSARWLIAQGVAKAATPVLDAKPARREPASGTTQGD
jgi:hypothetical protein